MAHLKAGDTAPDFETVDDKNEPVKLSDYRGKRVVLYFYPKDNTTGCTAEACAFRDTYDVFQKAGASVVGISDDSVASHQGFASHHGLPFLLLSDEGGSVRKSYRVPRGLLGLLPGRSTFVVDKDGVVQHAFHSVTAFGKHVDEAAAVVKKLAQS